MVADEESSHLVRLMKVEEDGSNNNNSSNSNSNSNRREKGLEVPSSPIGTVAQVKFVEVEEGTKPVSSSNTIAATDALHNNNNNNNTSNSNSNSNNDNDNPTDNSMWNHNIKNKDNEEDDKNTNSTTTTATRTILLDPYDAMADIAAHSHLRARTKRGGHHDDRKDDDDDDDAMVNDAQLMIPTSQSSNNALTTPAIPSSTTTTTTMATKMLSYQQQQQQQPQQTIVTASMSNHYMPPRLHSRRAGGSCTTVSTNTNTSNIKSKSKKFVGGNEANNKVANNNNSNNNHKNRQQVSTHLLQSVGLECDEDGVLRLDQFDDDDDDDDNNISINSINDDQTKITGDSGSTNTGESGNTNNNTTTGDSGSTTNNATLQNRSEKAPPPPPFMAWTFEQHREFAVAIFESGLKNCSPSIIMENMRKKPTYITRERTKSHLQKYRQTKERSKRQFLKDYDALFTSTEQVKKEVDGKALSSSSSPPLLPSPVLLSSDPDCEPHGSKKKMYPSNKSNKKKQPTTHEETIPKAVLTAALDGQKPGKLLGGKVAALLSYSVMNKFSTDYGPDQLQYQAAQIQEFPILTEAEKRTSVGASLLQVKSLLDNMTDALLKTRHGIQPLTRNTKQGTIKDDDSSVASSSVVFSDDDGSSDNDDDEDDCGCGGGKEDGNDQDRKVGKRDDRSLLVAASTSKDQDSIVTAADHYRRSFDTGMSSVSSAHAHTHAQHPLYQQGPAPPTTAAYSTSTYSGRAPPQAAAAAYSSHHPSLSYYGGGPPPPSLQTSGYTHPGYTYPSSHYTQDPRFNPYQQQQIPGSTHTYPGGPPPPQPHYYTSVAAATATTTGYNPSYYDGTTNIDYSPHTGAATAIGIPPLTATASGDPYSDHQQQQQQLLHSQSHSSGLSTGHDGQQHQHHQHSSVYQNNEGQTYGQGQMYERAGKRSKHRQDQKTRSSEKSLSSSLSIDTNVLSSSHINTTDNNCDDDFMDRVAKVPSPLKQSSRRSASSSSSHHTPVQSRKHRKTNKSSMSSPVLSSATATSPSIIVDNTHTTQSESSPFVGQTSSIKPKRTGKRSRSKKQEHSRVDESSSTPVQQRPPVSTSDYDFGDGCSTLPFSEAELSPFVASPFGMSPVHAHSAVEDNRSTSTRQQQQQQQHNQTSQFWDGPTSFMDPGFMTNDQQQQQQNQQGGVVNFEHPQQQQQHQHQQPDDSAFQPDHQHPQQQQRYNDGVVVDGQHVDASFSSSPILTESSSGRYFFGEPDTQI